MTSFFSSLEHFQFSGAIQHLYRMFTKRNDEERVMDQHEVSDQFDYIVDEIELIEEIIKRVYKEMAKSSGDTKKFKPF